MTIKSRFAPCILALAITGIASAKSYTFSLTTATTVGPNELKAGDYDVKLEGSQAIVKDEANGKTWSVPVKVEHNSKKFGDTAVEVSNTNGKSSVTAIDLGGSDTRIVIGQ